MCEAKPGPRCSADAKRNLNKMNVAVSNAETILKEKEKVYVAANNNFKQIATTRTINAVTVAAQDYELAKSNLVVAEKNRLKKKLEYFATPAGLEDLSTSSDKYAAATFNAASDFRQLQSTIAEQLSYFTTPASQIEFLATSRTALTKELEMFQNRAAETTSPDHSVVSVSYQVNAEYLRILIEDIDQVTEKLNSNR